MEEVTQIQIVEERRLNMATVFFQPRDKKNSRTYMSLNETQLNRKSKAINGS